MHFNGSIALYMCRVAALCALLTTSACSYTQSSGEACAEGSYDVGPRVLDTYIASDADYRVLIPCLYTDDYPSRVRIRSFPDTCRALWMRGDVDLSEAPSSSLIEYATIFDNVSARSADYVMSVAEKFPMVKVLELSFIHRLNSGDDPPSYDKPLDLGVFPKLRNLEYLHLDYIEGGITNSDALIDSRAIKLLDLTVSRELPTRTPRCARAGNVAICGKDCACKRPSNRGGLVSCVRMERDYFLGGEVRTFAVENLESVAAELPDIPGCCKQVSLHGRFKLSGASDYPMVESLFWNSDDVTSEELSVLQLSRFPNLRALTIRIKTQQECEIDFRKIDVCHSLESVDMWCSGRCVVRGMEDVFVDDRIRFFFVSFTRDLRTKEMREGQCAEQNSAELAEWCAK